jgi:hypothetical protein
MNVVIISGDNPNWFKTKISMVRWLQNATRGNLLEWNDNKPSYKLPIECWEKWLLEKLQIWKCQLKMTYVQVQND